MCHCALWRCLLLFFATSENGASRLYVRVPFFLRIVINQTEVEGGIRTSTTINCYCNIREKPVKKASNSFSSHPLRENARWVVACCGRVGGGVRLLQATATPAAVNDDIKDHHPVRSHSVTSN